MLSFLILCFSGIALGQIHVSRPHDYTDRYHEFTFEYHDRRNVLLAKSNMECYFLRVDAALEPLMRQSSTRYELEDRVYHQIKDHTGEHKSQLNILSSDLHDIRAAFECTLHSLWELTLFTSTTSAPTTTTTSTTTTTPTTPTTPTTTEVPTTMETTTKIPTTTMTTSKVPETTVTTTEVPAQFQQQLW